MMYNKKPKPLYKKGDLVVWRKNPEYDYKPGKITIKRINTVFDKNGDIDGYWKPTYRIVDLGPFPYYWLDEDDICFPDDLIYNLSDEQKLRLTLGHFRREVSQKWTDEYKGLNIHSFYTATINDLERLGYTFIKPPIKP